MSPKRERPIGITLLALSFMWIGGMGSILFPLLVATGVFRSRDLVPLFHAQSSLAINTVLVLWFLTYFAYEFIGVGLWRLHNWSRRAVQGLAVLAIGAGVVISLLFFRHSLLAVPVLIATGTFFGWLFWYTVRPRVAYAFGGELTQSQEMPPGMSTRGIVWTVVAAVFTFGLYVIAFLFAVVSVMRESGAYKIALAEADHSPCIASAIGKPIEVGWFTSGNIEESNEKGSADLSIPISGPIGSGKLGLSAQKRGGIWVINELDFKQQGKTVQIISSEQSSTCQ